MTDRAELKRLIVQIERDLLNLAHLKTLVATARTTIKDHRRELRTVETRLKRTRRQQRSKRTDRQKAR